MPTSVVLATTYGPAYLAIYEHLVGVERDAGNDVILVDISGVLATPIDSYHRGVLRGFGLTYPGHDLGERVMRLGAEYIAPGDADRASAETVLEPRLEEALAITVESALITYYRTDLPDRRKRSVGRVATGLAIEGRTVYLFIRELLLQRPDITVAYVPNGRFPHQKLATLAFQDAGVPTRHIEKGEGADRAYVQDYAPQDRIRSQRAVDEVLAGLSVDEVEEIADRWLAKRAPAKESINEFSALWDFDLPSAVRALKESGDRIAGFFTSSQDEFKFLGPEWQLHEWSDQVEAFDAMMTRLEAEGFRCYLRVHPNLATKAHDTFRREREGIRDLARRHSELIVIWHDDPANSYVLVEASDAVVVWDSTIGLEASARGLPVWTAATSRYGLVADIHEMLSERDVERDRMRPWPVDAHQAKRFIAYLVKRDQIVRPGAPWTEWTEPRPFGATLAAIAVSGGTPGIGAAVHSLVDVYRHRGLRANVRARRR